MSFWGTEFILLFILFIIVIPTFDFFCKNWLFCIVLFISISLISFFLFVFEKKKYIKKGLDTPQSFYRFSLFLCINSMGIVSKDICVLKKFIRYVLWKTKNIWKNFLFHGKKLCKLSNYKLSQSDIFTSVILIREYASKKIFCFNFRNIIFLI